MKGGPHVLQYIEHRPDPPDPNKTLYIITELCGIDLFDYFTDEDLVDRNLTEVQILKIMHMILTAVNFIHEKGWIHRDLKPENICVEHRGRQIHHLVILDFGFAMRQKGGGADIGYQGTQKYKAPELPNSDRLVKIDGRKSDVFSAGVIFYILIFGGFPFTGGEEWLKRDQPRDLTSALSPWRFSPFKSPSNNVISKQTLELLSKMLSINPRERPLANEALQKLEEALAPPPPSRARWKLCASSTGPACSDASEAGLYGGRNIN